MANAPKPRAIAPDLPVHGKQLAARIAKQYGKFNGNGHLAHKPRINWLNVAESGLNGSTSGLCWSLRGCTRGVRIAHNPGSCASLPLYLPTKARHQSVRPRQEMPRSSLSCDGDNRPHPHYVHILSDPQPEMGQEIARLHCREEIERCAYRFLKAVVPDQACIIRSCPGNLYRTSELHSVGGSRPFMCCRPNECQRTRA